MSDASYAPRRPPLEIGALVMLVALGFAAVVGFVAVIETDSVAGAFGKGLGIALLTFLTGGTLATALACLKRQRAQVVSLVTIGAASLGLDLLVLAAWLEIRTEAYAKITGVAFVWSFYALIALGLTLVVENPRSLARPLYLGAIVVTVVAGLITGWFILTASEDDTFAATFGEVPDDGLLRALGAALVLLAALWFGTLAASRIEDPPLELTR